MKKQSLLFTLLLLATSIVMKAQVQGRIAVKFTATDESNQYCPFTEVSVTNVTRGWVETLVYPDTTILLTISGSGVNDNESSISRLGVAWPNPFTGETHVPLELVEPTDVAMKVIRADGKEVMSRLMHLETGTHRVTVCLANSGLAYLVVTTPRGSSMAKLISYAEGNKNAIQVEPVSVMSIKNGNQSRYDSHGEFASGDMMSYVGKAVIGSNTVYSEFVSQEQYADETIVLRFVSTSSPMIPAISTNDVTDITLTTAIVGGNVTDDGGAVVTERGVCWGGNDNPAIDDGQSFHVNEGSGVGEFSISLVDLMPNTIYYVRAYAINSEGTAYGELKSFRTAHENIPIELCKEWGMSRNEVISFGNAYEIIDNAEDVVAFAATSHSRDTLMMYLFDSDSLYCTTIMVSSGGNGYDQLAENLLDGFFFMETQNEIDVFMNEARTTVAVAKINNAEMAISWVALPQPVVDTSNVYTGEIEGHEYVDLGLSVKWATCNIGADTPEEIGHYFQWGEPFPEINGPYQWYTYAYWTDVNGNGYVEPDLEIDYLIPDISGSQYDAATAMWTGTWRMPTKNEIQELINNCQIESVVEGEHNCFRITGPNGQSILMPATGRKDGQNTYGTGNAYIWSSIRGPWDDEAYGGVIKSNGSNIDHFLKSKGLTIRPVSN